MPRHPCCRGSSDHVRPMLRRRRGRDGADYEVIYRRSQRDRDYPDYVAGRTSSMPSLCGEPRTFDVGDAFPKVPFQ